MHKIMEREISKQEIARLLSSEKKLILDIGCHDGRDGAVLASLFDCEVHCFECDPRAIELWKSKDYNGNMKLWECALSNENYYKRLHLSNGRNNASSSLLKPKNHLDLFEDVTFEESLFVVQTMTLDSWFEFIKPRIIDFIWADVNGAEGDLIKGGIETLTNYTRYLYIEFSNKELYEGQLTKEELLLLLPSFYEIGEYNYKGNFGNVLLKNRNL